MYIAHEFNTYSNGEIKFTYNLAFNFLERENEVHLLGYSADNRILEKGAVFHKVKKIIEKPIFLKSIIFIIFSTIFVIKNRRKFNLIHVSGPNILTYHHLNTSQFVHSAYKRYLKFFNLPLKRKIYYSFSYCFFSFIEKIIYKKSKKIVAVSEKIKRELVKLCKIKPYKIEVIHNGVDPSEFPFKTGKEKEDLIKIYPFLENKTIFLFVGDIKTNRKGIESLIKAFKDLEDEKAILFVLGNERNSPYPEIVKKIKLENRIKFLGFKREISFFYRASDFFLYPTLYDPFPLVVLEALASLTPCIVSDKKFCGSSEIIEDGREGFIIKNPLNIEEIKEKIKRALENKEKLKEMQENIKRKIKNFYFENRVQKYEKVYKKVI